MLKRLKIKYFQCYEDITIDFHKGVNCIYGVSSAGKTSLFRAFELARKNRPSGFRFHSKFDDEDNSTEVEICTEDHAVKFEKTAKKAGYEIFTEGGSLGYGTVQFPKVGRKVPDEVKKALQFDPALIQQQLDPHFLITGSNSKFAKEINRVTDFEKVDRWKKNISDKIRKSKLKLQLLQEDFAKQEEEMESYSHVDQLCEIASVLNGLSKLKEKLKIDMVILAGLILDLHDINLLHTALKKKLNAEGKLSAISMLLNEQSMLEDFAKHVATHKTHSNSCNRLTLKVDKVREILLTLKKNYASKEKIEKKLYNITESKRIRIQLQSKLIDADIIKSSMLKELKKMKLCPFCKGPINDECISRLLG